MHITSHRTISACRGLLTARPSGVGSKASWPLTGNGLRRRRGGDHQPRPSGVPAKPASWGGCLLHHSHDVTIRGDSYRLHAKRRSDNVTAQPRGSVLRVAMEWAPRAGGDLAASLTGLSS